VKLLKMRNDLQENYRTLEVESGATWADVKRSYRELVKVWHPDRFAHEPALERKAQEKLRSIMLFRCRAAGSA
jgi:curved DNA-binding protein CbpA